MMSHHSKIETTTGFGLGKNKMNFVPTIDLKAAEGDVTFLEPLDAACRDHGFFLLRNHGMDEAISSMWQASIKRNQSSPMCSMIEMARTPNHSMKRIGADVSRWT